MSALEDALRSIIREELARIGGAQQNTPTPTPTPSPTPTPTPTATQDPFGGLGGLGGGQQRTVTPQELQALIMPHIANEAVKTQLSAEMQRMGVSDLGSARQEQLAPLYDAFSAVIQRATGGGGQATTQTGGII